MEGQTFSHYRVLEKLGEGGMGEVYLAEDTTLKRKVALKLLPETHQQDPVSHKRFIREAESAAALDHPYVCKIYEVGEHEGRNFIAMEYLRGQTLKERLSDGPLPIGEALRIGSEIAEALEEAHERGVVHRDLKPANIMLTPKGHAQVLDFGLAKRVAEDGQEITTEVTREGTTLGTLAYMSPEQLKGKPVDTRSDLFSFGVVLYEMLTGVHPFRKAEHVQTMSAILHSEPENLSEHVDAVPESLSQMVNKMLAKDPAERFQSVSEVVEILNDPSAPWKNHGRPLFGKWAFSALMLTLILTIALVAWWALREGASSGEPIVSSIAVLPLTNLSGDPEQEYFADGMTDALITDLCKIGALRVINRSSVMRYKNTDKSLSEIAQELNVEAVMEGSVLREADQLRVSAQLIQAATGNTLWAERYERELSGIIALQGEVAQAIARQIQVTLTPEEEDLLAVTRKVNPEAYDAVLKASSHVSKLTKPDLETALQYCEQALEKDPNYAPAYAGIAVVWNAMYSLGYVSRREAEPKAREAALKAIELDETCAQAHLGLAMVRTFTDWDWERGEAAFLRAIELNPNYVGSRAGYGVFLRIMARHEEALAHLERALELDPLGENLRCQYAFALTSMGRYDEAIEVHRSVLKTVPNHPIALSELESLYYAKGMYEEALQFGKAYAATVPLPQVEEAMVQGYEEAGYLEAYRRAAETLAALSGEAHPPTWLLPNYYTWAGQKQKALDCLERAFEDHEPWMPEIHYFVAYETLHDEPRFQDLLRRMNFPEDVIDRILNGKQ